MDASDVLDRALHTRRGKDRVAFDGKEFGKGVANTTIGINEDQPARKIVLAHDPVDPALADAGVRSTRVIRLIVRFRPGGVPGDPPDP